MDIGRAIRHGRKRRGLTQRALAERTGLTQATIARIETGREIPRFDTVERLLRACGQEIDIRPESGAGIDRTAIRGLLKLTPGERARLAAREAGGLARVERARR